MGGKASKQKGGEAKTKGGDKKKPQGQDDDLKPELVVQRTSIDCHDPDYSTSVHPDGKKSHTRLETGGSQSPNTTESDMHAPSGNFPARNSFSQRDSKQSRHSLFRDTSDSHQERLSLNIRLNNQQVVGIGTKTKLDQLLGDAPVIHTSPVENLASFHQTAAIIPTQSDGTPARRTSTTVRTIKGPNGKRRFLVNQYPDSPSNPLFRSSGDSHQERISFNLGLADEQHLVGGVGTLAKLNANMGPDLPVVFTQPVEDLGSFHFGHTTPGKGLLPKSLSSLSPHAEASEGLESPAGSDVTPGGGNAPPAAVKSSGKAATSTTNGL